MTEHHQELELSIREAFESGRMDAAACATLDAYGWEIRSFLHARLKGRSDALEAFSMFAEDLWTGLPKFAWRCSMRTWSYALARNAAMRRAIAIRRHAHYHLPLPHPDWLPQTLDSAREHHHAYLEGAMMERFRKLREQLDDQDQKLLALRLDNSMAWKDLAIATLDCQDPTDAEVVRESARLRKAFERVKLELRQLAAREGLIARPS